jgi:hypothetical protein
VEAAAGSLAVDQCRRRARTRRKWLAERGVIFIVKIKAGAFLVYFLEEADKTKPCVENGKIRKNGMD